MEVCGRFDTSAISTRGKVNILRNAGNSSVPKKGEFLIWQLSTPGSLLCDQSLQKMLMSLWCFW